ncbi:hypothetical protein GOV04_03695 [Candidatus Woesearchaeota archaeon]|nr:hypothetical protein [Candidatus Woesearchaeota archaeon]
MKTKSKAKKAKTEDLIINVDWLKKKFSKLAFEDKAFLVGLFFMIVLQTIIFSSFNHIPGPMYGGDLYRERGFTEHLVRGGNLFDGPQISSDVKPYYPWFSFVLMSTTSKITGLSIEWLVVHFQTLIIIIASIYLYLLANLFFKKKYKSLFVVMTFWATHIILDKPSAGLAMALAIGFFYHWLKSSNKTKNFKHQIIAGILLGLTALSHTSVFTTLLALYFLSQLTELIYQLKTKNFNFRKFLLDNAFILGIAFFISLFYYGPLIYYYKLQTINKAYAYSLNDPYNLGVFWSTSVALKMFFNWKSILVAITGVVALLGFISTLLQFKKSVKYRLLVYVFVGTIIAAAHYLITIPLFNEWAQPDHFFVFLFLPKAFFIVLGTELLANTISKNIKQSIDAKKIFVLIMLCLVVPTLFVTVKAYNNNQWVNYAQQIDSVSTAVLQTGEWVKQNTDVYDVFLTTDESAFALNGVSGAKVVFSRRVHANYFIDIEQLYADGIVMLYTADEEIQKKLLDEYNVKYLYLDAYSYQSPMIVDKKYAGYLQENNINYTKAIVRLDPSTTKAPTTEALVIPVQNFTVVKFFEPLIGFSAGNQQFSMIYSRK